MGNTPFLGAESRLSSYQTLPGYLSQGCTLQNRSFSLQVSRLRSKPGGIICAAYLHCNPFLTLASLLSCIRARGVVVLQLFDFALHFLLCEVVSVSWKQVITVFSGRIPSLFLCVENSLEKLSSAREFVLPFDLQCPIHFLHLFRTPLPATTDFLCTLGNCSDVVTRVCCCLCLLKPFALVILRKLKFYLPVLLCVCLIQQLTGYLPTSWDS